MVRRDELVGNFLKLLEQFEKYFLNCTNYYSYDIKTIFSTNIFFS